MKAFRITTIVLLAVLIVLVIANLGFQIWTHAQPDATGLAGKVEQSMNDYFAGDDRLRGADVHVTAFTVMRGRREHVRGDGHATNWPVPLNDPATSARSRSTVTRQLSESSCSP